MGVWPMVNGVRASVGALVMACLATCGSAAARQAALCFQTSSRGGPPRPRRIPRRRDRHEDRSGNGQGRRSGLRLRQRPGGRRSPGPGPGRHRHPPRRRWRHPDSHHRHGRCQRHRLPGRSSGSRVPRRRRERPGRPLPDPAAPSAAGTLIGRRRLGPSLSFRSWPARASVTPAGTTLTSPAATSPASS